MKNWLKTPAFLVAILTIFSLLVVNFSEVKTFAQEGDGPKESTKKFFGEKGGGAGKFEPEECKRERQQGSGQGSNEQSIRQQGEELSRQIREKEEALRNATTDEERNTLQSALETLKQRAKEMESQSSGQGQDQKRSQGPSTECKAAIVKMGKERMATFAATITNNILPKLTKVDEIVSKVEAKIPDLKDAGVSAETISKLENNIATIKSSATTMKTFFSEMIETLNSFLSLADSDTKAAFSKMQTMHKSGKNDAASTAADALVSAFTELEEIIEELKTQGGSDGNQ